MLASTPPPTATPTQQPSAPPITSVTNGSSTRTKVELQASYAALIAGLEGNYQPGDVFELPMGDMTRDELIALFTTFVNAAQATKSSNQVWRTNVQAERAAAQSTAPVRAAVKVVLVGKLGKSSIKLLGYGFQPAKVPARSTASKSAAVAKTQATRVARGTRGSQQKKAIKGNVTGVIITPVTAGPSVPVTEAGGNNNAASGTNGAGAPAAPASPAATGGTPPHS